jgi:tetratricopeptide (TPR) repeat protein/tRNA A-37 threonylcarbamoyl transferase component Bud32
MNARSEAPIRSTSALLLDAGGSVSSFMNSPSQNELVTHVEALLRNHFNDDVSLKQRHEQSVKATDIIAQRYRIERVLGQGSFGVVYLAFDLTLHRHVALKVPRPEHLSSAAYCERVLAEARHAASLDHPHIVQVFEVFQVGPIPIIVSGYCAGPHLAAWISNQTSTIAPKQAAAIVRDVADALAHAHQRGVLHRDLKPANILMSVEGEDAEPLITDFGLARRFVDDESQRPGLCGTLRYMAPEVITSRGQNESTASDIYSIGLVLWQLASGKVPFEEVLTDDLDFLATAKLSWMDQDRSELRNVPRDLRAIVSKCVAGHPQARYLNATDLQRDLERYLQGHPVSARKITRAEHFAAWCRRESRLASALGVLAAIIALSIPTISWLYLRERGALRLADQRAQSMRVILQDMSATLADARLTNVPHMDETRIALLERSVAVYRELVRDKKRSEQGSHDLSVALHRLANAYSQTGQIDEGRKLRMECLEIISKLRAQAPRHAVYRYDEFMNLLLLGGEWRGADAVRAATLTNKAYHVIQSLAAEYPDNVVYCDALAAAGCDVATDLSVAGRFDEARQLWEQAARQSKDLWAGHQEQPLYLKHAVHASEQLGNLAVVHGDLDEGVKLLTDAWNLLEIMLREIPEERSLRGQKGNLLVKMADASLRQGKYDVASQRFSQAIDVWSNLSRDYPDVMHVREWIATANYRYALGLVDADRSNEAVRYFEDALKQFEALARQHPEITRYAGQVAELNRHKSPTKALQASAQESR